MCAYRIKIAGSRRTRRDVFARRWALAARSLSPLRLDEARRRDAACRTVFKQGGRACKYGLRACLKNPKRVTCLVCELCWFWARGEQLGGLTHFVWALAGPPGLRLAVARLARIARPGYVADGAMPIAASRRVGCPMGRPGTTRCGEGSRFEGQQAEGRAGNDCEFCTDDFSSRNAAKSHGLPNIFNKNNFKIYFCKKI